MDQTVAGKALDDRLSIVCTAIPFRGINGSPKPLTFIPASLQTVDLSTIQVIIPAWNEEFTIAAVISQLRAAGLMRIRVVDNGSTDATAGIAKRAGADVLAEPLTGYGRACWRGMANLPAQIEWVLFCDADGSDVLDELPVFFTAAEGADFILGNRRSTPEGRRAMTAVQDFGNWLATTLIRLGWGGSYSDLAPLRMIRREALERIGMEDRGFGWTVEMQTRAIEEGLKICEAPVRYRHRQGGNSKISGTVKGSISAGTVILGTLGKLYYRKTIRRLGDTTLQRSALLFSALFLLAGALVMAPYGDFRIPGNIPVFLTGAVLMGMGFTASFAMRDIRGRIFWCVALATRLLLLPMAPGDDIWRYLWEGMIQHHGFSPYALAPASPALAHLRTAWWPLINHPGVTTIYPPLAQLGFRFLTLCGPPSIWLFKLSFVAADLGCCALLKRRFGARAAMLYAWNPLVIYSFAGGGHYDAWFLFALVAGWLALEGNEDKTSRSRAFLLLGASVALKYISLPIAAAQILKSARSTDLRTTLRMSLLVFAPFVLSVLLLGSAGWVHLIPGHFANVARSSEFIPYWVGLVWPDSVRMNWIYGIVMLASTATLILFTSELSRFCERYLFALLLLSPAVHGWYFVWLTPFAVKSRNPGTILVSMSAFTYFWLQHRKAVHGDWIQSVPLKLLLWLPFILGFFWNFLTEARLRRSIPARRALPVASEAIAEG